jgi:hypothetical protein
MSKSADPSKTTATPLVITSFPSIPLTTTFTPPATDCGGVYRPRSPDLFIVDNEPSCLPPNFSTSDSSFFYSPGIACPSGYWTACHDTAGVSSITTVTCCPTYGADISLSCVPNPAQLRGVWETLFCTWIAPASGTAVRVTLSSNAGRTSTVAETMTSPGGLNAYGVRMVYQASDLEAAASSSSSSASSGAAGSTTSSIPNPTGGGDGSGSGSGSSPATSDDPAASSSDSSGGGLSTGAIAAIGVVVPLVVIGAALLGFALWWRRRKRLQQDMGPPPPLSEVPGSEVPGSALPGYEFTAVGAGAAAGHHHHHHHQPGEQVQGKQPAEYYYYGGQPQSHEMGTHWVPSEMPDTGAAYELPGTMPKGSG